jgi:hypothetical protein
MWSLTFEFDRGYDYEGEEKKPASEHTITSNGPSCQEARVCMHGLRWLQLASLENAGQAVSWDAFSM